MKILLPTILLILSTGCVAKGSHQKPDTDPNDPIPSTSYIEERVISDEIRKSLGVQPNEPLIAIINNKPTLLVSEKFKSAEAKKEEAPVGKTLTNVFTIIQTTNSPSCFWYRDIWGNKRYFPVPDCPH